MSDEIKDAAQQRPLRLPSLSEAYEDGLRRGRRDGFDGFELSMYAGSYATQLLRLVAGQCHETSSREELHALWRWEAENEWLLSRQQGAVRPLGGGAMGSLHDPDRGGVELKRSAKAVVSFIENGKEPADHARPASIQDLAENEVRRLLNLPESNYPQRSDEDDEGA